MSNTSRPSKPDRKHPAHGVSHFIAQPTIVFITACTKDRRPILANDSIHRPLIEAWSAADAWQVGRYVIMPDHVHLFAAPTGTHDLPNWMRFWKSHFTKKLGQPIWQTDFWDRRLRNDDSYEEKWHYVWNNPVRAGLVKRAEDWALSGELHVLRWR